MDGRWDTAGSGHVDAGETATGACARECAEELGIRVMPGELAFARLTRRLILGGAYYDIYFRVPRFTGGPTICEPEKSSELAWFPIDDLPEELIDCRREDLAGIFAGEAYGERVD